MDTPPTMSQFASREACLSARDKWFQEQLQAAKQRELELLAVIEILQEALAREVECDTSMTSTALALSVDDSALREHEAKVLEEAASHVELNGYYAVADELRRMAEERRKK